MKQGAAWLAVMAAMVWAAGAAAAEDRHAGYYYPPPATTEVYKARVLTLADSDRDARLGFVVGFTQQMTSRPYPPQFALFAKGEEAEKMIIVGLRDGGINTLYRARALLALMTSVARGTRFLNELGIADFVTFFDLAKLLGFRQITISDGDTFAHQIVIE